MEELIEYFRIVNITLLVFILTRLVVFAARDTIRYLLAGLILTILAHFAAPWIFDSAGLWYLRYPTTILAGSVTGMYCLVVAFIFVDDFRHPGIILLSIALFLISGNYLYFYHVYGFNTPPEVERVVLSLVKLKYIVYIVFSIFLTFRDRAIDVLEWRRRLRIYLLVSMGLVFFGVALAELLSIFTKIPPGLVLLKHALTIVLIFVFSTWLFPFQQDVELSAVTRKVDPVEPEVASLENFGPELERLNEYMERSRVWLEEGLTIAGLASKLEMREYKLRKIINSGLSFRNFNQYLNSYRIKEACRILADPQKTDLTVLRLAYDLGYASLAPFNLAFKKITGITPTEFRKTALVKDSKQPGRVKKPADS